MAKGNVPLWTDYKRGKEVLGFIKTGNRGQVSDTAILAEGVYGGSDGRRYTIVAPYDDENGIKRAGRATNIGQRSAANLAVTILTDQCKTTEDRAKVLALVRELGIVWEV